MTDHARAKTTPDRSAGRVPQGWWLLPAVAAILFVGFLVGCSKAFRSGSVPGTTASLEFLFADGTEQTTLPEGGTVAMTLWVPRTGHAQLLGPGGGMIDPDFLTITTTPGLGSFSATDDLAPVLDGLGFIQAGAADGGRVPVAIDVPLTGILEAPAGQVTIIARVTDDVGKASDPMQIRMTVVALDRPTAVLTLEQPPISGTQPSGLPLPPGTVGDAVIGEQLPFVLVVRGIPNPATGARFDDLLAGGTPDPAFLVVTADQALGDPTMGGIPAGQNLASLFGQTLDVVVDPVTGEFTAALAVWQNDLLSPAMGLVNFEAILTDDDGVPSDAQHASLQVDPATSLLTDVLPISQLYCGLPGCHDFYYPVLGLQLDTKDAILMTAVLVDAFDTDETTSCAPFRIQPYDPNASYAMHKVWGTHLGGCVDGGGLLMPPGPNKPSASEIDVLAGWILQGAYDN